MAGAFVAGHLVPVKWKEEEQADYATLNIKEHSLDISVLLHDVTGYKAMGVRARIAGPMDVSGRVVLDLDLEEPPWQDVIAVMPGFRGLAQWGVHVDGAAYFQLPLICEKVHFAGGTDKELMWDADMKCSSLAGDLVYPQL